MSEVSDIRPGPGAESVRVASLLVIAEKVVIEKKEEEKPPDRRGLVNSILFAILMALLTVWFSVHLDTYFTQTVFLGTVTIWSVIHVFVKQMKAAVGDDTEKWWKTAVRHARTTMALRVAIAAALLLFLFTSSIYVKLGDTKASGVEIEVLEDTDVLKDVRLGTADKIGGGPLLSSLPNRKLLVKVKKPGGYQHEPVTLRPGEALELTFPEQFRKRTIARIFVPYRLRDPILEEGDDQYPNAALDITIHGATRTVQPFSFKTAYVGVSDKALASDLIGQSLASFEAARREEVRSELRAAPRAEQVPVTETESVTPEDTAESIVERYLAMWRSSPEVRPEWDLVEGDVVKAVYRVGTTPVLSCLATVSE